MARRAGAPFPRCDGVMVSALLVGEILKSLI
jgi:hypothetical protein